MGDVIAFEARQLEYGVNESMLAVGAEQCRSTLYFEQESVAEVVSLHRINFTEDIICVSADVIPGLDSVRQQARAEAEYIIDRNRQSLRDGDFSSVPLDVDALGTAAKVALIGDKYGKDSEQFMDARSGLVLDCSRKWAEAFRKNSWEYFGETIQQYVDESNELIANGLSVDDMVINGLSPVSESEEAAYRVNDYVRHATHKTLVARPDADALAAISIAPCPQWALDSYERNPHSAHGGYAPEIEKLMINFDWYNPNLKQVSHEQIGVSGIYITGEVIAETLQTLRGTTDIQKPSKTDIHAMLGIVPREVVTGATDILKILDEVASQKSGLNIFLGEPVAADHSKDYQSIYAEAEARRAQQETLSEELACFVEDLHSSTVEPALATVMVEKYIQEKLLEVAASDPRQAEIIFNKETAEGFAKVQTLERLGLHEQAENLRMSVEQSAPPASSCGAGSCGLEEVGVIDKMLQDDLKVEAGDTILRDTVRGCRSCGEKKIVYAFNKTKVNKLCEGCGAFESKKTK